MQAGTLSVVVTGVIGFAAGMQIAAFREVGRAAFTTTVMTTNSMRTVNAALTALASADSEDRAVARAYATALAGFVAGAFLGAFLTTRWGERAAWVDAALFAVAAGLYAAERRALACPHERWPLPARRGAGLERGGAAHDRMREHVRAVGGAR